MKSLFVIFLFFFSFNLYAQQQPPPLYEAEEESLPSDLAIEKPAPQKQKGPEVKRETPPPPNEVKTEVKPEEGVKEGPPVKIQVEKEIELPSPAVKNEIPVPVDLTVIKPPEEAVGAATPDGGPLRDAGGAPENALPVTFTVYERNFLSPMDPVDFFQLYTRAMEGVGVIFRPRHPSSLLACDLLGREGELLSQTEASQEGQTVAFQTSPLTENALLYLRVQDRNLSAESPLSEIREYSLELRPIAPLPPPTPASPGPAAGEVKAEEGPEKSDQEIPPLWKNEFFRYGLGIFAVLVSGIVLLGLIRRRKKQ